VKNWILYGLVVTQLFACAALEPLENDIDHELRAVNSPKILAINNWHLFGRLSVRDAKESGLVKLDWRHGGLIDELTLGTSIGGVIAKLTYVNGKIIIVDSDGNGRIVTEEELRSEIGYAPPLNHLKFWIRGLPNPAVDALIKESGSDGRFLFEQDGWNVNLTRFKMFGEFYLPAKVSLNKDDLEIKLVVDEWLE
jgi:outer membrane lipoprotein LolB